MYEPDRAASREYAQQKYLESEFVESWPESMLDQINALGEGGAKNRGRAGASL